MKEGRNARTDPTDAQLDAMLQESSSELGSELIDKLVQATRHLKQSELRRAAKAFRKIIHKWPEDYRAYKGLAHALGRSNDSVGACEMFLRVVDILQPRLKTQSSAPAEIEKWAESWISAFDLLIRPGSCSVVPKPSWWNDECLVIGSGMVMDSIPDYHGAWNVRGMVLSGSHALNEAWTLGPVSRSATQLYEAAECARREAALHRARENSGGTTFAPAERARCERVESEYVRRAAQIEVASTPNDPWYPYVRIGR
eukprot:7387419-Prymnesium_polylepis.1